MAGLFCPVIERNTAAPASRSVNVVTAHDGQRELRIAVYQGESRFVAENASLGQLTIGVPAAPAGQEQVEVRLTVDTSGLLEVEARAARTGVIESLIIEGAPGALSPEEISARLKALESLKTHPRDQAENLLLERLKAEETGVFVPDPWREPLVLSKSPTGWTVIGSRDFGIAGPERLSQLSAGGEAIGCWLCEVTMASEVRGFRDGAEVWSIQYDCDKRLHELVVEGSPPSVFDEIFSRARAEQDSQGDEDPKVDFIFNVPQQVAEALCGFGPYAEPQPEMDFYRLRMCRPARGGLLGRLFGRSG